MFRALSPLDSAIATHEDSAGSPSEGQIHDAFNELLDEGRTLDALYVLCSKPYEPTAAQALRVVMDLRLKVWARAERAGE